MAQLLQEIFEKLNIVYSGSYEEIILHGDKGVDFSLIENNRENKDADEFEDEAESE